MKSGPMGALPWGWCWMHGQKAPGEGPSGAPEKKVASGPGRAGTAQTLRDPRGA